MATGPLRFRTPYIEELPVTQQKQAPGFAWIAVSGPVNDPSKNWGTTNRKRARNAGIAQTDIQREAVTAKQQDKIERKLRELNSDGGRDVVVPTHKKEGGGNAQRAGKTSNTKKILASGKTFAHYLDDEEAEIARTGKRDGDLDVQPMAPQRASKTPLARRKGHQQQEESIASGSPAPSVISTVPAAGLPIPDVMEIDADEDEQDPAIPAYPSQAEMESLLNAPPLTYNQARSAPPPLNSPPSRRFCEICGYWGRAKCMKCGNMTCSVACKETHDEHKCLKFYA